MYLSRNNLANNVELLAGIKLVEIEGQAVLLGEMFTMSLKIIVVKEENWLRLKSLREGKEKK